MMTLEDAALREARERRVLLRQSIIDERNHLTQIENRKEWTQRFSSVSTMLEKHQQEAQNASRDCASQSAERSQQELFEHLIPLRPLFDRVTHLQNTLTRLREIGNEEEQELQHNNAELDAARAAYDVAHQRHQDAREALQQRVADINAGYHIEGTVQTLERQLKQNEQILRQLQLTLNDKEQSLQEIRQQEAAAIKNMEEANTQVKGLSAHSSMLGMYDLVKDKLSAMAKERSVNDKLHAQQTAARREREMMQLSIRQREGELSMLESEGDQYKSQLLLQNQSADTVLDIVRAPIIRDPEETQRQLDKFLGIRTQIRHLEEQIQIVKLQLDAKRTQLDELHTEAAVAESHMLSLEQNLRESDNEVASLYTDLDKIITLSGWFTEWQHSPDGLRSRISELYHQWLSATNRYNELSNSTALLRSSLAAAEKAVAEARQQEQQQRNLRDAIRRELEDQNERLRATFGEQTPQALEQFLTREVAQTSAAMATALEKYREAQKNFNRSQSCKEIIQRLQRELQDALREANAAFDIWLENNNNRSSLIQRSVVEDIFNDKRDWSELRRRIIDCEIKRAQADTRLEDSQRELAVLQRSAGIDKPGAADSAEQLLMQRHEATNRLEKFEEEYHEIEGLLHSHERALRKMEQLRRNRQ